MGKNLLVDILRKILRSLMRRIKSGELPSLVDATLLRTVGPRATGDRSLAALTQELHPRILASWWAWVRDVGAAEGRDLVRTGSNITGGWGRQRWPRRRSRGSQRALAASENSTKREDKARARPGGGGRSPWP